MKRKAGRKPQRIGIGGRALTEHKYCQLSLARFLGVEVCFSFLIAKDIVGARFVMISTLLFLINCYVHRRRPERSKHRETTDCSSQPLLSAIPSASYSTLFGCLQQSCEKPRIHTFEHDQLLSGRQVAGVNDTRGKRPEFVEGTPMFSVAAPILRDPGREEPVPA